MKKDKKVVDEKYQAFLEAEKHKSESPKQSSNHVNLTAADLVSEPPKLEQ